MEKHGIPTSTIVSTAFATPGRLAAKNLQIEALPLLVTPHPLNDLKPDEVRDLARVAYPVIIQQLSGQSPLEATTRIDYVHPASLKDKSKAESVKRGGKK